MNFNKILASVEYKVLERNAFYLQVQISNSEYLFYNENGVQCFDLFNFKEIGIVEFFEKNFPLSNLDIIAVSNQSQSVNLNFEGADLSKILGNVFKLKNFDKIQKEELIHESAAEFVTLMDFILPSSAWKYSKETNQFFIIPNRRTFLQFNSNYYKHFGESFRIKTGSNPISFLNPFTLMDYYSSALPNESDEISIGPTKRGTLVIRSTEQELRNAIKISVSVIGGIVVESNDIMTIRIDLPFEDLSGLQNKVISLFKASVDEFESLTAFKYKAEKKFFIKPKPRILINKKPSSEILFVPSIHMMQLVVNLILNPFNKELQIDNISFSEPSYFEDTVGDPNDALPVPDEIINEYFS